MKLTLPAKWSKFPKATLLNGPTPIQRLHRLEQALACEQRQIEVYIKHDDASS